MYGIGARTACKEIALLTRILTLNGKTAVLATLVNGCYRKRGINKVLADLGLEFIRLFPIEHSAFRDLRTMRRVVAFALGHAPQN